MSTALTFAPLYNLSDNTFWPTLARQQVIPTHLASAHATPGMASRVGMGMVKAVHTVLSEQSALCLCYDPATAHWTLFSASRSTPGLRHVLGGNQSTWWIEHMGYLQAMAALADALSVSRQTPMAQEFVERWDWLLQELTQQLGSPPPYPEAVLQRAAYLPRCNDLIMATTDALYFFAKQRANGVNATCTAVVQEPDPAPLLRASYAMTRQLVYDGTVSGTRAAPSVAASPQPPVTTPREAQQPWLQPRALLAQLLARGGCALLVGGTGVGKSELALDAAVAAGVQFVSITGRPTMDDRDLLGHDRVVGGSPQWVDGPLAEAWRAAQSGARVTLLINELMRFDPHFLSPLLGALDPKQGRHLQYEVGVTAEARSQLEPDTIYHVLALPNGERLIASKQALSILVTTNMGDDYVQLQQQLDAALYRRFDLLLDIHRLPTEVRRDILMRQGIPEVVALILARMEDYTVHNTAEQDGLLQRELNLGTCIAWAQQTAAFAAQGLSWARAVIDAASVTAFPFVCPRGSDGYLEQIALDSLQDELGRRVAQVPMPGD